MYLVTGIEHYNAGKKFELGCSYLVVSLDFLSLDNYYETVSSWVDRYTSLILIWNKV